MIFILRDRDLYPVASIKLLDPTQADTYESPNDAYIHDSVLCLDNGTVVFVKPVRMFLKKGDKLEIAVHWS